MKAIISLIFYSWPDAPLLSISTKLHTRPIKSDSSTILKNKVIKYDSIHTIHLGNLMRQYFTGDDSAPSMLSSIEENLYLYRSGLFLTEVTHNFRLTTRLKVDNREYIIDANGDRLPEKRIIVPLYLQFEADIIDAVELTYLPGHE